MKRLVPKSKATRPYKLEIEYEHGDADFKTKEACSAGSEQELIELHAKYTKLADALWKAYEPYDKNVVPLLEGDEEAIKLLEDVPYDQKYDASRYRARICELKLFVNGVEMEIREQP